LLRCRERADWIVAPVKEPRQIWPSRGQAAIADWQISGANLHRNRVMILT
jgi:hypothetical protein